MRYPAHVAVGEDPSVLRRILEPGINLAIWQRPLNPALQTAAEMIVAGIPIASRTLPTIGDRSLPAKEAWAPFYRTLPSVLRVPDAEPLVADLRHCMKLFVRTVRPERLSLSWRMERFNRLAYDWHSDTVRYRLICCYYGEPTRWLAEGDAASVSNRGTEYRKKRRASVRTLPSGAVCIFRGTNAGHDVRPLVHSEPRSSKPRLLLVIND